MRCRFRECIPNPFSRASPEKSGSSRELGAASGETTPVKSGQTVGLSGYWTGGQRGRGSRVTQTTEEETGESFQVLGSLTQPRPWPRLQTTLATPLARLGPYPWLECLPDCTLGPASYLAPPSSGQPCI